MTSGAHIRVVIADDHELVRSGLRAALPEDAGFRIVAEAADGLQVLGAVGAHRPDVVLMDLNMPNMGGVEATRRIVEAAQPTAVLVLTMYDDDGAVQEAVRAGASGYLLKGASRDEIQAAVRSVAGGGAVFGAGVAANALARVAQPPRTDELFPALTSRERSVLELLAGDLAPPVIARRLGLAEKTVRNSISSILTKLGVADRAEAVAIARRAGLGKPG